MNLIYESKSCVYEYVNKECKSGSSRIFSRILLGCILFKITDPCEAKQTEMNTNTDLCF